MFASTDGHARDGGAMARHDQELTVEAARAAMLALVEAALAAISLHPVIR